MRDSTHTADGENSRPAASPTLRSAIRYTLIYGWLWICLVAAVATNAAVMMTRGAPWRGDIIWTIDWLSIGFILAGPLISGFVAIDTHRLAIGVRELPLPSRRSFDMAVLITYSLTLVCAHLLFMTITLAISQPPVLDAGAPVAIGAQLGAILFFVAIGSLVGRFAPPVLGGVSAALAALIMVYLFSAPNSNVGLLYLGAATTPRIGYSYNTSWLLIQLAALTLLIMATVMVRPSRGRARWHTLLRAIVALSLVSCAGVAISTLSEDRLQTYEAQHGPCGSLAGVPWCYFPQHERVMHFYADNFLVLFQEANSHEYGSLVPEKVIEADQRHWPSGPHTAAFYVTPEALAGERPSRWETTLRLIEPVHCPQLQGDTPPSEQYWNDLDALTATWVGLVDPREAGLSGYSGKPLSPDQAEVLIESFRSCTYPFQ